MKVNKLLASSLLALMFIASCKEKEGDPVPEVLAKDDKYVRLLVGDAESTELKFINMHELTLEKFDAAFSPSALYTSSYGRFAFVNSHANNYLKVFDSGIEDHGDHVHDEGASLLATSVTSSTPIHFHEKSGLNVFFNDGDGSLTLLKDSELDKSAYVPVNISVVSAHHGAAVPFTNGTIAVTEKDDTLTGKIASLPQKVIIVNQSGTVLFEPSVRVKGIHGSSLFGNGKTAIFGSTDGVLLVKDDGNTQLIPMTQELVDANKWFGSVEGNNKLSVFYGMASGVGIYKIDPSENKITSVFKASNILTYYISEDATKLVVATKDGGLKIFDATSASEIKSASSLFAPVTNDAEHGKFHPNIVESDKYYYVTSPETGELIYINKGDLTIAGKYNIGGKPTKMTIF